MPKGFELFWRVQYYSNDGKWKTGIYLSEETARCVETQYKRKYGRKHVFLFAPKRQHKEDCSMLYEEYMKKMDEIASSEISPSEKKERRLALKEQAHRELQVGDGVTVCLWSDRHAGTIIKRTPKTIVIQEDKATLSPDFKPEFSIGGFCAHCTNQSEQSYTYEKDERGSIYTARWSEKRKRFVCYDKAVMLGRHKFHDYNF